MRAASSGLRHPASASCLGRHLRLAGRCPNNRSLFPPLAAVVVVAAERLFFICSFETPAGVSILLFHGRGRGWIRQVQRRFLRKRGAAGEDENTCGEYPFSLATLASSPKGAPFGVAAKFAATAKAVPLGKVAKPKALTEGVSHGSKLPQSSLRDASPLWDGAFGMAGKFPSKVQSARARQRLPPRGSWQSRRL